MEHDDTKVLERLREFIDQQKMKRTDLAAMLGVSEATLSNKLSGARALDLTFIRNILIAFPALSPDYLLFGRFPILRKDLECYTQEAAEKAVRDAFSNSQAELARKSQEISELHEMLRVKDTHIEKLLSYLSGSKTCNKHATKTEINRI